MSNSLLNYWISTKGAGFEKHIQQIIAIAGNGKLLDGNVTSSEFREFLDYIPSDLISQYAYECFDSAKFDQKGFVLQDLVNQIGRRLSFTVEDGLYRGRSGAIGYDGIWRSDNSGDIVVEVKTTDVYSIDLDAVAEYRKQLINNQKISSTKSSILIIVGIGDTGSLEAQIRGSRHAWDMRLISVDALIKLMTLKEQVEEISITNKIHAILTPQEFTRIDGIIDLVFSTAEDVKKVEDQPEYAIRPEAGVESSLTSEVNIPYIREAAVQKLSQRLNTPLSKQSRSTYSSPNNDCIISCAVSKQYIRQRQPYYWFAFHPSQKERLEKAQNSYAVFVCGTEDNIFAFPIDTFDSWLERFNQTINGDRYYWHIHIVKSGNEWLLNTKAAFKSIPIQEYLVV